MHSTSTYPVACMIMASGRSKRFGSNKLLTPLQGKPMVQYAMEASLAVPFEKRLVVTVHEEVASLAKTLDIPALLHSFPDRNDAIAQGVAKLIKENPPAGILFCPSDQPGLRSSTLQHCLEAFAKDPTKILRVCHKDMPGTPVIFPASFFEALLELPPKQGGGYLIKQNPKQVVYVPVEDAIELFDIDTPEDFDTYLQKSAGK